MFHGWLKYAGLFLLSAWMFSAGVLVGRGTSPVEFDTAWFQKRLSVLFGDSVEEAAGIKKPELEFYDKLRRDNDDREVFDTVEREDAIFGKRQQDRDSADEDQSTLSMEPLPQKRSRKGLTLTLTRKGAFDPSADIGDKRDGDEAEEKKRLSKSSKSPSHASIERGDTADKEHRNIYTIQIASYRDLSDAATHVSQLKAKGYPAYQVQVTLEGERWYRVRSGGFGSIAEAQNQLKAFQKVGIEGLIIKNEE